MSITKPEIVIDEEAETIQITLPLKSDAPPSKSGKTRVIASTHGNYISDVEFKGHQIILGLNAFYKPE